MVQIPNGGARVGDLPSGEPVPEATYHVRVDKAKYAESKEKKTPMAEIALTIFGPAEAEEFHGRKIFDNLMLAGEGAFRTRQLLEATGENEDFVLEDTDQLVGREVQIVVVTEKERREESTGKTFPARSKVARYQPIDG
jgi:hypothetical protein